MNIKEITEIKNNFSNDSGFFTMNHVVSAFVDLEKKVKYKSNINYSISPSGESKLIMMNLKKILSGKLAKNLIEYKFPKDSYSEGGSQRFFYDVLQSKLKDDEASDKLINAIVENVEYAEAYSIFAAHCTYSVLKKNKNDDSMDEADFEYNFIITAICPTNLRIDDLIYNDKDEMIQRILTSDKIIGLPTDGFLFPLFSDRSTDVNGVLYYTKNAKKPNTSVVDNLLGCEFVMSAEEEKATFIKIINNITTLDYQTINIINKSIQNLISQNKHETEPTTINCYKLSEILYSSGISKEAIECLPNIYRKYMGDKPFTALNLVEKETVLKTPGITVKAENHYIANNMIHVDCIDGKRCIVVDISSNPDLLINGFAVNRW